MLFIDPFHATPKMSHYRPGLYSQCTLFVAFHTFVIAEKYKNPFSCLKKSAWEVLTHISVFCNPVKNNMAQKRRGNPNLSVVAPGHWA